MLVTVRFDEIFLKGKNQGFFVRQMRENLKKLFTGITVKRIDGGLLLQDFPENPAEFDRLALVPGVAKLAEVVAVANDFTILRAAILEMKFASGVQSFRVTANRSYKKYPLVSREINEQLGAALAEKYGWRVDLTAPELNIFIDIDNERALIYTNPISGAGGLPTGASGRILVLLSGGIDSPVAGYSLMKRGAEVVFVHCQNETQVSEAVSRKIFDLVKQLARYQPKVHLYIIPFADYQREIIKKIPAKYRMIASRRQMFRLAERLAEKNKIFTLASGDSLAQVASQTLENMRVIYTATDLLKIAPLVGMNKIEIVKIARRIGTMAISERPYEDCCSLLVATHPETRAKIGDVERLEKKLDFTSWSSPRVRHFTFQRDLTKF